MNEALDGVREYLDATTEAALAALEAEYSVTIPRVVSEDTADLKTRQFPSLEILPDSTMVEYIHPEGPLDREAWDVHSVSLILSMVGSDPKEVEYALLYYRRAWVAIVRADNTFGGRFNGGVKLGQSQYWPMVQAQQGNQLLQVLRQNLLVRVYQS